MTTEAEKPDEWDVDAKEIAATAGIVLATLALAMMVPSVREWVAQLLNNTRSPE